MRARSASRALRSIARGCATVAIAGACTLNACGILALRAAPLTPIAARLRKIRQYPFPPPLLLRRELTLLYDGMASHQLMCNMFLPNGHGHSSVQHAPFRFYRDCYNIERDLVAKHIPPWQKLLVVLESAHGIHRAECRVLIGAIPRETADQAQERSAHNIRPGILQVQIGLNGAMVGIVLALP